MALIYESGNFRVESVENPLIDRADGGHLTITPKVRMSERQQLSPRQAIELMRLTLVAGEAMTIGLRANGIDIGRINYQDNGNWSVFLPEGPHLHIHLYGRAKNAVHQPYGQTLHFPHRTEHPELYSSLKPLTATDVLAIQKEMVRLFSEAKYKDQEWGLL
jgi:diadenosine tetraphosphate (Ap4A) HIT family hydrolase